MEQQPAARTEQTMLQRLQERTWHLIVRREIDLLEVTYGFVMLIWGAQLVLPGDSFSSGLGYRAMAQLGTEWAWGVLFLTLGLAKIVAYLLDFYYARLVATLGAVMVWTFLAVAFGYGSPYGLGIVFCPAFAFSSALIFWRLLTHRAEYHG